jgi:hypothetical protein
MARTTEEVSNFVSRLHSQTISQRLGTALNIDVKTVGAKPILRDYFNFCMFVRWAYCNRMHLFAVTARPPAGFQNAEYGDAFEPKFIESAKRAASFR